jgi:hypothetical protein
MARDQKPRWNSHFHYCWRRRLSPRNSTLAQTELKGRHRRSDLPRMSSSACRARPMRSLGKHCTRPPSSCSPARIRPQREFQRPVGEFVALLMIETLPLTGLDALGEKVKLKPADCPGAKVSGTESPLILNSLPITFAWEIVTLPVPIFVRVTTTAPLSPSTTLPKLVLVGLP